MNQRVPLAHYLACSAGGRAPRSCAENAAYVPSLPVVVAFVEMHTRRWTKDDEPAAVGQVSGNSGRRGPTNHAQFVAGFFVTASVWCSTISGSPPAVWRSTDVRVNNLRWCRTSTGHTGFYPRLSSMRQQEGRKWSLWCYSRIIGRKTHAAIGQSGPDVTTWPSRSRTVHVLNIKTNQWHYKVIPWFHTSRVWELHSIFILFRSTFSR